MIRIALIFCLLVLAAGAAQAETAQDRLVSALKADGYVIVETERTWLGRLRVVATRGDLRREVVINPGTGEVLRDIAHADTRQEGAADRDSAFASGAAPGVSPAADTAIGVGPAGAPTPSVEALGESPSGVTRSDDDVLLPEAGVMQ